MKFANIKKGDTVTRLLAGVVQMKLIVGKVDDTLIYCGSADGVVSLEEGWKFRRDTGAEVDEDLNWDGITKTGSYLILENKN